MQGMGTRKLVAVYNVGLKVTLKCCHYVMRAILQNLLGHLFDQVQDDHPLQPHPLNV